MRLLAIISACQFLKNPLICSIYRMASAHKQVPSSHLAAKTFVRSMKQISPLFPLSQISPSPLYPLIAVLCRVLWWVGRLQNQRSDSQKVWLLGRQKWTDRELWSRQVTELPASLGFSPGLTPAEYPTLKPSHSASRRASLSQCSKCPISRHLLTITCWTRKGTDGGSGMVASNATWSCN